MYVFKSEAALVLVLLVGGISWDKCSSTAIEPYEDDDLKLIDATCGASYNDPCCPNLKVKFEEGLPGIINEGCRGGKLTCQCRCGIATNRKEIEADSVSHYFCKAGFGPTVPSTQAPGANGGEGGADASKSGASILQLCKVLVFAVLMAAGTMLVICN